MSTPKIQPADGDMNKLIIDYSAMQIRRKAQQNISNRGLQDLNTLIKCAGEEFGEICRADLDSEGAQRIIEEARDLAALCIQIECLLKEGDKAPFTHQ